MNTKTNPVGAAGRGEVFVLHQKSNIRFYIVTIFRLRGEFGAEVSILIFKQSNVCPRKEIHGYRIFFNFIVNLTVF